MTLDPYQKQVAWNAINLAKRELEVGDYDAPHLANYYLRDLNATKEAGLSDLAWAIHGSGNIHKNDVLGLIEHLEKYLLKDEAEEAG